MKKKLIMILGVCMIILAGCGNSDSSEESSSKENSSSQSSVSSAAEDSEEASSQETSSVTEESDAPTDDSSAPAPEAKGGYDSPEAAAKAYLDCFAKGVSFKNSLIFICADANVKGFEDITAKWPTVVSEPLYDEILSSGMLLPGIDRYYTENKEEVLELLGNSYKDFFMDCYDLDEINNDPEMIKAAEQMNELSGSVTKNDLSAEEFLDKINDIAGDASDRIFKDVLASYSVVTDGITDMSVEDLIEGINDIEKYCDVSKIEAVKMFNNGALENKKYDIDNINILDEKKAAFALYEGKWYIIV